MTCLKLPHAMLTSNSNKTRSCQSLSLGGGPQVTLHPLCSSLCVSHTLYVNMFHLLDFGGFHPEDQHVACTVSHAPCCMVEKDACTVHSAIPHSHIPAISFQQTGDNHPPLCDHLIPDSGGRVGHNWSPMNAIGIW